MDAFLALDVQEGWLNDGRRRITQNHAKIWIIQKGRGGFHVICCQCYRRLLTFFRFISFFRCHFLGNLLDMEPSCGVEYHSSYFDLSNSIFSLLRVTLFTPYLG